MDSFRYLENVATIHLDPERCVGCGECETVCPHGVLAVRGRKAEILDRDGCMECGACAVNCPAGAVRVTPGVGCAAYIIKRWVKGRRAADCGDACC